MTCWLCSDKVLFWRAARIKAGLGAEPPNLHPNYAPAPAPVYAVTFACVDCGATLGHRTKTNRCQRCAVVHSNKTRDLSARALSRRAARRTPLSRRYVLGAGYSKVSA